MIELKQIYFSYADGTDGGLKNINLSISSGECVLLCGRSGCGKTTITRLINGLIPGFFSGELKGEAAIDNESISATPMYKISSRVGSVFQNPRTQFFNVDTDSEIAFGIENEAVPPQELHKRLAETADALHINSLRERSIFELSGGEKQKIAFASVYAMNPDIYLLDEPSSNLDIAAIKALREHLRLIKAQGKTILIAEHRLYYLMDIADRIVYLEQGHIAGEFIPSAFQELSANTRKEMGLRAIDLKAEPLGGRKPARTEPVLELRDVALFYEKESCSAGFSARGGSRQRRFPFRRSAIRRRLLYDRKPRFLSYKKQPILERINMKATPGEVIAVVGHNGAGKTTFSRALCGLHKDCSGEFLWNGTPQNDKDRSKHSYMVMQDVNYELFADSVKAECSFGIRNPSADLIEDTMDRLELMPYQDRHPNTLSGGQKQRVAVAVSMICGKELLVFDEPTSGLDYDSMAQVAGLIRDLASSGKIVFVVTHDYEFICQSCSRLIHFDNGTLVDDLLLSEQNEKKIHTIFDLEEGKDHV